MNARNLPYAAQPTAGHETHGQTAIYSEADGRTVALVCDGKAHAAFIVRACNAHNALVAALRDMVRYDDLPEADKQPAVEHARAALAKAQGGAA